MDNYIVNISNDLYSNYFHFTKKSNLDSISKSGLSPRIGCHAKYIEKTKKVFFVEGLDNLLILFDCWINVYYYLPKIPFIYTLGAFFLRQRWFPQIIADGYFGVLKKVNIHKMRAFKVFDKLLNESVLLNLKLEEGLDFSYDDFDEIKMRGYKKRHLEVMGYSPKYAILSNSSMDKWNLHTFTNQTVDKRKIKLCTLENGSYELRDIFNFCIENTKIDIKNLCPNLYEYLRYKKNRKF